jgi:RNA polymerase sigma-70 factor (ECF subfamily)
MSPQPLPSSRREAESRVEEPATVENSSDLALGLKMLEDPVATASELHARFTADVNRLVWRLLGADPDHNDIVQQVFYKVMLHGRRLRDPSRLGAWVQSITVNTVYEELRRRDVRRLFARDSEHVELHSDLVRDVESRDLLLRAKCVIDKLPAKERIVFLLHFVEERPLLEVAELCGYSLATAKRRLNAANRRFQLLVARNTDLLGLLMRREEREK